MLVTDLATKESLPPLNSQRKVEKYCQPIISLLNDNDKALEMFEKAINIIDTSGVDIDDKQFIKSKTMTDKIIQKTKELNVA
jgi:hypothetical protein